MFHAYESWEDRTKSELLQGLFGQPGLRQFVFVEVPLNNMVFHVDVAPRDAGGYWRRFIFSKFRDILDFSMQEKVPIANISVQSRRENGQTYSITNLKEVYEITTSQGLQRNLFVCVDGTEVDEEPHRAGGKPVRKIRVWPKKQM